MPSDDLITDPATVASTWKQLPVITSEMRLCLACSAVLADFDGHLIFVCPSCGRVWDEGSIGAQTMVNAITRSRAIIALRDKWEALQRRAPEDIQIQRIGYYLEAVVVCANTMIEATFMRRIGEIAERLLAVEMRLGDLSQEGR